MTATTTGQVLLVNNFDDREMYAEYLRDAGLIVHAVADPAVALGLLPAICCDVVITDLVFAPGAMSGTAFMREIRARVDPSTSIIVVSGCVRQEDREEARQAGGDLFLIKPALPSAVLFEVRRALTLRKQGCRIEWNWRDLPPSASATPTPSRRRRRHVS
jgi:two-component system, cell cycle response regulator DivK